MSRHVINISYIWDGIVPLCHATSLRMVLEFYGVKYSPAHLMNLSGFNYGFRYSRNTRVAYANPITPLGPWEYMAYAAEKLGCITELVKDKSWDETWELLKSSIEKDVPVLIARLNMEGLWKLQRQAPHLIVLCGYDEEKGVVIAHDPALGEVGERIQYMPDSKLPRDTSGSYIEYSIDAFKKAFDLTGTPYEDFGKNGFVIIQPPTERPLIDWAEVIDRNAKLTLGKVEEVIGKQVGGDYILGPHGILALAADVERGFNLLDQPEKLTQLLFQLRGSVFNIGSSYKIDAHAFVAGLAAATNNRELEQASYHLRFTALHYEEGLAQVDLILHNQPISQEELKLRLSRIAEVLRRAAESERQAGESLSKGAKSLQLVPA